MVSHGENYEEKAGIYYGSSERNRQRRGYVRGILMRCSMEESTLE
jgi:hypothetical protein